MAIRDNAAVKRLHKHLDFLSQLYKAKTKQRRAQLLTIATPEQIHTVCECIRAGRGEISENILQEISGNFRKFPTFLNSPLGKFPTLENFGKFPEISQLFWEISKDFLDISI